MTYDVTRAAMEWWESKRPGSFSEEQHLEKPEVYCVSFHEKQLATAVACHIQVLKRQQAKERRKQKR